MQMGGSKEVVIEVEDTLSSEGSFASTVTGQCCSEQQQDQEVVQLNDNAAKVQSKCKKSPSVLSGGHNYATSKNVAEGKWEFSVVILE